MQLSITGKSFFLNKLNNEDKIFDFGTPENFSEEYTDTTDIIFSVANKIKESSNISDSVKIKKIKYLHINSQDKRSLFIYPPEGPLPRYAICSSNLAKGYSKCKHYDMQDGKLYHQPHCRFPIYNSLHLSVEGFFEIVIKEGKFPNTLETLSWADIQEKWKRGNVNKELLECIFEEENIEHKGGKNWNCPGMKVEDGIPRILRGANGNFTKILLNELDKKRGPKRETLSGEMPSVLFLTLEYPNKEGECSIKIWEKGLIKIDKLKNDIPIRDVITLLQTVISDAISESPESFDQEKWKETTSTESFSILDEFSYNYELSGGFRFFPKEDSLTKLDINKLHEILVNDIHFTNKIIFMTQAEIKFEKYEFWFKPETINQPPSGWTQETRKTGIECFPIQGKRNPGIYIKFVFPEEFPNIKLSVTIQSAGAVQFVCNYINTSDIGDIRIDSNQFMRKLSYIFEQNIIPYFELRKKNFVITEKDKNMQGIKFTTRTGKKPSMIRIQSGTKGENIRKTRPEPYNFSSTCADPDYFIHPGGKFNEEDGLYYPICSKLTKEAKKELKEITLKGFPSSEKHINKYQIPSSWHPTIPDEKSGVIPLFKIGDEINVKISESSTAYDTKAILLKSLPKSNEVEIKLKDTAEIIRISKTHILPEDRRLRGLEKHEALTILRDYGLLSTWIDANRNTLINALQGNYFTEKERQIIYSHDSSLAPETEDVINFFNIYSRLTGIMNREFIGQIFYEMKNSDFNYMKHETYYIYTYPQDGIRAIMVVSEDKAYITLQNMHIVSVKKIADDAPSGVILDGYYSMKKKKFYPMDILCYDKKMLYGDIYSMRLLYLLTIYDISDLTIDTDILNSSENAIKKKDNIVFIPSGDFYPEYSILPQDPGRFSASIFHFSYNKVSDTTINFTVFQNIKKNNWQIGIQDNGTNMLIPRYDEVEIGKVITKNKNFIPGRTVITCKVIFYNDEYYKLHFDKVVTDEETLSYEETLQYINEIENKLTSDNFILEQYDDNKGWLIQNIFYFKDELSENENGLYKLISEEL